LVSPVALQLYVVEAAIVVEQITVAPPIIELVAYEDPSVGAVVIGVEVD
jgi:AmiR/NasT family two-component response regulator